MIPSISRKRLAKLIGKRFDYQATYSRTSELGHVLLVDIMRGSKLVSDHVWVTSSYRFEENETVCFSAVANTYIDSHGIRKLGLYELRDVAPPNCSPSQGRENKRQMSIRKGK